MAFNPIILQVNQQDGSLADFQGSIPSWPKLFQGSGPDIQIGAVNPTGDPNKPYLAVNNVAYTMKVTGSLTPNGNGTQTILFGPTLLVWSAPLLCFTGTLDLTQANLALAIGANASVVATVEIELVLAGVPKPIYQDTVTIYAPADPNAVVTPQPPINYYTAAETNAIAVRKDGGNPGDGFILTSLGGKKTFFSLGEDGSLIPQILN